MCAVALPRIQTLDSRVRSSETFPRIRDAEVEMKRNEEEFLAKMKLRDSRRLKAKQDRGKKKKVIVPYNEPPKKEKEPSPQKQYFTGYVLNKDPNCSKYMPFDEVYFPKLFNTQHANTGPETIDNLWLLGFQDMSNRKTAAQLNKTKAEVKNEDKLLSLPRVPLHLNIQHQVLTRSPLEITRV